DRRPRDARALDELRRVLRLVDRAPRKLVRERAQLAEVLGSRAAAPLDLEERLHSEVTSAAASSGGVASAGGDASAKPKRASLSGVAASLASEPPSSSKTTPWNDEHEVMTPAPSALATSSMLRFPRVSTPSSWPAREDPSKKATRAPASA